MAKLGDAITKKLTTTRFYMQRTGEGNFIDLGNVVDSKYSPDIQRAEHQKSERGIKQHDFNIVKGVKLKYELTLEEQTEELRKLKMLGTQGADVVQAAGNITAEVLCTTSSKQGRTYFTVAQGLSAVVVKVAAAAKAEGTDYTVDPGSGAITILAGGTIADNSTVTVDYTKALVTTQPVTGLKELRVTANFRLVESDQFSEVPRAVHTFSGQLHVMDWGDNNGEDFEKPKIEVLCSGIPVVSYRKD